MLSISDRIHDAIRNHDYDEYKNALEDMTNPDNEDAYEEYAAACINTRFGHFKEKHTSQTYMDIINRIIHDRVSVSLFNSREDAAEFVDMAIFNKLDSIAQWMTGDRESGYGPNAINKSQWSVQIDFKEPLGRGFDTDFREKETSVMNIVLRRTLPGEPGPGFVVHTAYPNIETSKAKLTGRILDFDFIKQQDKEKQVPPLYYAYMQMRKERDVGEQMAYHEATNHGEDDSYISYDYISPTGEHFSASLNDRKECNTIKYTQNPADKIRKIPMESMREFNPSVAQRVEQFQKIINKEMKEKSKKKAISYDAYER